MRTEVLIPSFKETHQGLILQRGGEELGLKKVKDRFTVCFAGAQSHLPSAVVAFAHEQIPCQDGKGNQLFFEEITVTEEDLEEAMHLARDSQEINFVSHVYQVKDNPETVIYLTNQITIQFAPQLGDQARDLLLKPFHLELIKSLEGVDQTFVYRLTDQTPCNPLKITNLMQKESGILIAEVNVLIKREYFAKPQTEIPPQWYFHHQGGKELAPQAHLDLDLAWPITKGKREIIIAIADGQIDCNHEHLGGKDKIVAPQDFTGQNFQNIDYHKENHGTVCALLALGQDQKSGLTGVAPECGLMPLRIPNYIDDQGLEDLCNYVREKNASILLCCWGANGIRFPLSLRQNVALHRLATEGRQGKGCVIIFAAGNANRPVNGTIYERGWQDNLLKGRIQWLNGFACHPDVITVSACTSLNKKAVSSNWGEEITVCAPSNNPKPEKTFAQTGLIATAPPLNLKLRGLELLRKEQLQQLGYEQVKGGTSTASALVAGVAGLILSVNPDLTAREVKGILEETADKIVDLDPDPQLGMRLGTYNEHNHSLWFGYGKVNAYQGVKLAQSKIPQPQTTHWIIKENCTQMIIPDDEPMGVLSQISIEEKGLIKDVKIKINIDHQFLGDLEISLRSPQEQVILLQNRSLGCQTSLNQIYALANTPALNLLLTQPCQGDWFLWVVDYGKADQGRLNGWEFSVLI